MKPLRIYLFILAIFAFTYSFCQLNRVIDENFNLLFKLPLKKDTSILYPNGKIYIAVRVKGKSTIWQTYDTSGFLRGETTSVNRYTKIMSEYFTNGIINQQTIYLSKNEANFVRMTYNKKGEIVYFERYRKRHQLEVMAYPGFDKYIEEQQKDSIDRPIQKFDWNGKF